MRRALAAAIFIGGAAATAGATAADSDEKGWRPVEIILADASRALYAAQKGVCSDGRRDLELSQLRERHRALMRRAQRAIGDIELIIPVDNADGKSNSCDTYPSFVTRARKQMDRVDTMLQKAGV